MLHVALCCLIAPVAQANTVNRIVAVVNDEVITEADVELHVSSLLEQPEEVPEDLTPAEMRQAVLQRLIQQRLLLQEAKKQGIAVTTDEVMNRLEEIRERAGSESAFQQQLAESRLTKEQLKDQIQDQLMVQRLIDLKVRSLIFVSPHEVAQVVGANPALSKPGDRVRALHLLIRVNEARSAEKARALIGDVHRSLERGADFVKLAKRYSEDPHRNEGGDLGWVAQGELLPELDQALFSLTPGECSGPIQTELGWHLIKAIERKTSESLSVTEANHAVFERLYQQKFQEIFARWMQDVMQHAYIEVLAPETGRGG
jgi:peptidyl-prolyl cis-trans isomerase SurA